ncbi:MAG TPA: aldose 1-epimerase [Solirubrobacteraceae bacterium]|nr:aldose 1-epimerase [Solirubrobacteraceae bacterium]
MTPAGFAPGDTDARRLEPVQIETPDGELTATFAPGAGMLCASLRRRGEELLAQRAGPAAYLERGKTMGIPLLHPWANRLAGNGYACAGHAVELAPDSPLIGRDPQGLPIHGVQPRWLDWRMLDRRTDALTAELEWSSQPLLSVFPFPHVLRYEAIVADSSLTIAVTLRAGDPEPVPVAFGFHPYLSLAGMARERWTVKVPVRERLVLDSRMIPTGAREPFAGEPVELAQSGWDDAFASITRPARFSATAHGQALTVEFLEGFDYAQVFSPADAEFVCFEPMTAPANALNSGEGLRFVEPGEELRAAFRIEVA